MVEASKKTQIQEERENINTALMEILSDKARGNNTGYITKEELEASLKNKVIKDDLTVSYRRPGEEHQYLVTIEDNIYGIKENNEVELLEPGIRNQYIEVTEVAEETPRYLFESTVKQDDIDAEINAKNTSYSIIGVSTSEDGEYVPSGNVEGKSGYLSIVNLQEANFEYTLNNFFQGDEVFYVKIQIGNNLEKIQKLTIVQGDIVKYEENFAGIEYTGNWNDIEEEIASGGKTKITETQSDKLSFSCLGKALDFSMISDNNKSIVKVRRNEIKKDGTSGTARVAYINFTNNKENKEIIKFSETKERQTGKKEIMYFVGEETVEEFITISNFDGLVRIDSIWIYK